MSKKKERIQITPHLINHNTVDSLSGTSLLTTEKDLLSRGLLSKIICNRSVPTQVDINQFFRSL